MSIKTVIVTGANRGIGLGLCEHYLDQNNPTHRWRVIAACRNTKRFPPHLANSDHLTLLPLDITDNGSIDTFAALISASGLSIDLLINNAGYSHDQPFGQWTQDAFSASFLVNAIGPALLVQALVDRLNVNAKIIQMSSGLASIQDSSGDQTQYCAYAISKCGLNMLSAKLSNYFKVVDIEKSICVASINPGWVKTDMGGPDADDTTLEAVSKIARTIESLTVKHSGQFLDSKGHTIAW